MSRLSRPASSRILGAHGLRPDAARRIVASTGLAPPDVVIEFGAGAGALTELLSARCRRVVAIEADRTAWSSLKSRFQGRTNVEPVLADFMAYQLPEHRPYRLVSNVPYGVTARLFRRLMDLRNPPVTAHLVIEQAAAFRWLGLGHDSVASILLANRFESAILLAIHRRDFEPRPNTDSVLVELRRRRRPLLDGCDARDFEAFVRRAFNAGTVGAGPEGRRILAAHGMNQDARPHELTFEVWVALFRGGAAHRAKGRRA